MIVIKVELLNMVVRVLSSIVLFVLIGELNEVEVVDVSQIEVSAKDDRLDIFALLDLEYFDDIRVDIFLVSEVIGVLLRIESEWMELFDDSAVIGHHVVYEVTILSTVTVVNPLVAEVVI